MATDKEVFIEQLEAKLEPDKMRSISQNFEEISKDLKALHSAIKSENICEVVCLLNKGIDVKSRSKNGDCCLHVAVKTGNMCLVELFTDFCGVNITNFDENTPLHIAVMYEKLPVVEYLWNKKADINAVNSDGETPLHLAVKRKNLLLVIFFLDCGADANLRNDRVASPILLYSICNLYNDSLMEKVVNLLLKYDVNICLEDRDGQTALHLAAAFGTYKVFKKLAQLYVNTDQPIDDFGTTPLHMIFCIDPRLTHKSDAGLINSKLRLLISRGANVNAVSEVSGTPICAAITKKHINKVNTISAIEYLLEAGANVDGHGVHIPIFEAIRINDLNILRLLLAHGANVNRRNCQNRSALFEAIDQIKDTEKLYKTLQLLLQYGATAHNNDALYVAAKKKSIDMVKFLYENGGVTDLNSVTGHRVFVYAIEFWNSALLKYLIEIGANLNFEYKNLVPLSHAFESYNSRAELRTMRENLKVYSEILEILIKRLAVLASQNITIHLTNVNLIKSEEWIFDKFNSYCNELTLMKITKVCPGLEMSFYDFLVKRGEYLVNYVSSEAANVTFKSQDYKKNFPHYADELEVNYLNASKMLLAK